jgi:3-mercaptopyruvate sulfurtransferase SseA
MPMRRSERSCLPVLTDKATAFKAAAEMQQVIATFAMDRHRTHPFYCQSGVRSTTAIFALYLMMG